ncbi:Putative Cyanovirin-N superfamily [Colletotrichum destructivum]|uniref:Cyanovirin-N superfamily n=1 Tax=Colletotrichum destructivum TaxID=34406 RepID=A0AAX4IQY8_9PEZI|nr:Putative Cyanovirin-N superfamily [Colletotrichum destructivum]
MRASTLLALAAPGLTFALALALAESSDECLLNLGAWFAGKGLTDQPGLDTFGGVCKGTRVLKGKFQPFAARDEWLLYSCCRTSDGRFPYARYLALQNCIAFNDVGGGAFTWQKTMSFRLAESCPDCKVVDGSLAGAPGAHLRCTCAAPNQAPKTYELSLDADRWAEGDVRGEKMSRYPCGLSNGMMDCGWSRCVRKSYEHGFPPGHWHGPGSPDANDPR